MARKAPSMAQRALTSSRPPSICPARCLARTKLVSGTIGKVQDVTHLSNCAAQVSYNSEVSAYRMDSHAVEGIPSLKNVLQTMRNALVSMQIATT